MSPGRGGGARLKIGGSFCLSSQVSLEMGRARRRPGAQLGSAQRGNGKTTKPTNAKPRLRWRAGKGLRRGGGGGGGVGAEGFAAFVWRLRSPTPSPAFVRSQSALCCDCRRSLKSALGLGSPRLEGAQVPGLKLCRLFEMCTQCCVRARPGVASSVSLLASHWRRWGSVPVGLAGLKSVALLNG